MDNNTAAVSYFEPGADLSGIATTAVVGKRFVAVSGNKQADGSYSFAPATAAARPAGIAAASAGTGERCTVRRGFGRIMPVVAGATLTANVEVEVGTGGTAVPFSSGVKVGFTMTGAANGADAEISLYI